MPLPLLRLVLAVSLDGRLAPPQGGAAQIGGPADRRVLEEALAWADAALVGAETLRRHGSTCLIHHSDLLERRRRSGLPPQPRALVVSRSARLPAALPFFRQPLERWLISPAAPQGSHPNGVRDGSAGSPGSAGCGSLVDPVRTASAGAAPASAAAPPPAGFQRRLVSDGWPLLLAQLAALGQRRLLLLGGARLASSLIAADLVDELQLTLCPRLLGGEHSWLAAGPALPPPAHWRLLESRVLAGDELLLRYGRADGSAGGRAEGSAGASAAGAS